MSNLTWVNDKVLLFHMNRYFAILRDEFDNFAK